MTTLSHIYDILKSLEPLEILEVCKLDDDPEKLVHALADYTEDQFDEINDSLVELGLLQEDEV